MSLSVRVDDAVSGLADGEIEIQHVGTGLWWPLETG
jgi:hypothetical protein